VPEVAEPEVARMAAELPAKVRSWCTDRRRSGKAQPGWLPPGSRRSSGSRRDLVRTDGQLPVVPV